jgi:2',3'-cyclic-nucleotide 2'-phosphodiesterase (5'-nucleotidase family)
MLLSNHTMIGRNALNGWLLLLVLSLNSCTRVWHTADMSHKAYPVQSALDAEVDASRTIETTILPYRQRMQSEMSKVIGESEQAMPKGDVESLLSNWFGDMIYRQASRITGSAPDFAFMNSGGIRLNEMPAGPVTVSKIYELMPFDNHLVIVSMKGRDVEMLFQKIALKKGGWPVSAQIKCRLHPKVEASDILINGQALELGRTYRVATSNFLADGGDNLDFMIQLPREDFPVWIRDMMIQDVVQMTESGQKVRSVLDGRTTWRD